MTKVNVTYLRKYYLWDSLLKKAAPLKLTYKNVLFKYNLLIKQLQRYEQWCLIIHVNLIWTSYTIFANNQICQLWPMKMLSTKYEKKRAVIKPITGHHGLHDLLA